MKWFKHMTASWDDEKLASVVGKGGDSGLALYGAYWRIAEIVAAQMEGPHPSCAVSYPVWRWSQLLFVRKSYLCSILLRLKKEALLVVEGDPNSDQSIIVKMPNLLKYRDEYSKKSGQNQDNVPSRTEGEAEAEKKPPLTPPKPQKAEEGKTKLETVVTALPLWLDQESWAGFIEMRKRIKKPLTDKAAKIAIGKLESWRTDGYNPTAILDEAIMNNWQGLYLPKGPDGKTIAPAKPKVKVIPLDPNNPDDWIRASFDPETGRQFDPANPADRARCTFNAETNQWGNGA